MAITWTAEEIIEFDRLVEMASSLKQLDRIESRLHMPKFIQQHGKDKCDAMFAHIESGGSLEASGEA